MRIPPLHRESVGFTASLFRGLLRDVRIATSAAGVQHFHRFGFCRLRQVTASSRDTPF